MKEFQVRLTKLGSQAVDCLIERFYEIHRSESALILMFTGIIEKIGIVENIRAPEESGRTAKIGMPEGGEEWIQNIDEGSSISVNGVCLTATDLSEDGFRADMSDETLERTNLSELGEGNKVNLEASLNVGDELAGHFVFGHVDSTVPIRQLERSGDFHELRIDVPDEYVRFCAEKGSVALDGISLTINDVFDGEISIQIIPHTYENTVLKWKEKGDNLNLEVDMLARYVYSNLDYSG